MIVRGIRLPAIPPRGLHVWLCPLFRTFCSAKSSGCSDAAKEAVHQSYNEAYRQLQNLDFLTATKMLFTAPPKKKKFGLDFHLVQFFFACMPSLAVYLVAQYARYEIRRMEAEVEQKKQQEEEEQRAKEMEEEKAIQMESAAIEGESKSELLEVKVRLDALEEAVKEISNETKKLSGDKRKLHEGDKEGQRSKLQNKSKSDSQHVESDADKSTQSPNELKVQEPIPTTNVSNEHPRQVDKS